VFENRLFGTVGKLEITAFWGCKPLVCRCPGCGEKWERILRELGLNLGLEFN